MKKLFLLALIYPLLLSAKISPTDSLKNALSQEQGIPKKIALYNQLGTLYANQGQFEDAIATYGKLLQIYKSRKQTTEAASTYNEIGNAYSDLGNNKAAFNSYHSALKLCPPAEYSLKAKINKNIGAIFLSWKNLKQALYYYNLAEELATLGHDKITTADVLNNKGTVYEQLKNYPQAFAVYNQALTLYKAANLNPRIALTYNNLAILAKVTRNLEQASEYYRQSVVYAAKADNAWLTAAISNNLGNLLTESGKYPEGKLYLEKALALAKKIEARELVFEALENLAENEARQGNFQKAYAYHKEFSRAQNEFINLENTKEVTRLQTEFETEKKEKALAESKAANLQSQIKINQKNNLLLYAGLGILFVAGLSVLIYRNAKIRQHQLESENSLNLQLASAEARNKLQEEKLRISRELHDNIGSQLTFINSSIQSLNANHADLSLLPETQKIAQNTISELRRTVWFINKQEVELEELVLKIRDYLKPLQSLHVKTALEVSLNGNCTMPALTATNLFRIIQEGVNNALKYAQAQKIQIQLSCEPNQINLLITDNGVGFNYFVDRDGYGLKNMHARALAMQGTSQIESVENEGTRITVAVPV